MQTLAAVLPLRGMVLLPGVIRTIPIGRDTSVAALRAHLDAGATLIAVPQLDPDDEDAAHATLARAGVLCQVLRAARLPDGSFRALVEGLQRVRLVEPVREVDGALAAPVLELRPADEDPIALSATARHVFTLFEEFLSNAGIAPPDQQNMTSMEDDPERLADSIASQLDLPLADRIAVLEEPSVGARLEIALDRLAKAIAAQRIAAEVSARVQAAMDQGQREYHLKEQLKAIRAELGDAQGSEEDADRFETRIAELGMPEAVHEEAMREVGRLRRIHVDGAEYTILRTWLEAVCDIPWSHGTTDRTDLGAAQHVLDEDHFGLDKVKERILEYLAVRQLNPNSKGPILCFVGPPGVGKTSLGRSIARALGRQFGRIALGGIKDETEIRGHRRTYIGALPGRIIRALSRAGTCNPVLLLDEIDKVGNDFRGDPSSALLEVLDPEQNHAFVDHYLDVAVDLSQVMFVATANLLDTVPPALHDRMEVIEIPGYTEEEKLSIARRFLLPRLAESHGLNAGQLVVTTTGLARVVRDYTREAGVRNLERELANLHRKVARRVVEGQERGVRITDKGLPRWLGPPRFFQEAAERVDQPGVVVGLAWTATGGDILFIEATRMPGTQSLKLTGSLGEVMKESAEAAMSWLRTHALEYGVGADTFEAAFHLHVPAGAIPKDGPSAGVTMLVALASLVIGRPVLPMLAMTGEITLRGKVLPVGGVKEKVLAARRAGVRTVILPRRNQTDLEDVPGELRKDLRFEFVETCSDVLRLALALDRT